MSKADNGESPKTLLPGDSGLLSTKGADVGPHLSLQAQDGFMPKSTSPRIAGEPMLLVAAGEPQDGSVVSPIERRRQEILRQQNSGSPEISKLCTGIQTNGNLDNSGLNEVASYLQSSWQKQRSSDTVMTRNQVLEMNAKFDQLATPGGPHYHLSLRKTGNNLHLELTDLSVRPQPVTPSDPRAYQTQESRNRIAQQATEEYRRASLKGSLDFSLVPPPPEPGDGKPTADILVDRLSRMGLFSDPASGANRRAEIAEAQRRFPDQASAPEVVRRMNEQLEASHSEYHLKIEPPSNYRKPAIYQAMQISIVDKNGKIRDFVQIPPGR
jgi:hypothetical protein